MKSIILAAGYATRLYPLTKNFPKPLLEVAGKPVINNIIEKIEELPEIKKAYVVTNSRYFQHFQDWKQKLKTKLEIEIIDDKTSSEETRLGAIGDMNLVIQEKNLKGPLLIIAGDNLFDISLLPMYDYFKKTDKTTISLIDVKDVEKLKKGGSVLLDKNNRIIHFEEKSQNPDPKAYYASVIYFLTNEAVKKINQYIAEGNNPDQPGRLIQWLYTREETRGFLNENRIIDIGTPESLEKARKEFY